MKKNLNKILTAAIMASAFTAGSAQAGIFDKNDFSAEELAKVKITIVEAISKAQTKQSGTPVEAKLEKEDGKIVYDIEFYENGKEVEMVVDAITGEVESGDDD